MGGRQLPLEVLGLITILCYTRSAPPPLHPQHQKPKSTATPDWVPPGPQLDKRCKAEATRQGRGPAIAGVAVWSGWSGAELRVHRCTDRCNNEQAKTLRTDLEPVTPDDNDEDNASCLNATGIRPENEEERDHTKAEVSPPSSGGVSHHPVTLSFSKTPNSQGKSAIDLVNPSGDLREMGDVRKAEVPTWSSSFHDSTTEMGVVMYVVNQRNAKIVMRKVFPLGEYWAHWADLQWNIQRIQTGRLVALTVSGHGASGLRQTALTLASLGSAFALHLTMYAHWSWIFIKGGKTISETVILRGKGSSHLHAILPLNTFVNISDEDDSPLSKARRNYCEQQDGMGDLCDEENPVPLPLPSPSSLDEALMKVLADIPIIITAGNRHQYLYYTLVNILRAPGVHPQNILVILGDTTEATLELLSLLRVNFTTILNEGEGNSRLFRYYRKVYDFVYHNYANASAAIFLDEDIQVSPDFFSFMSKTIRLLKEDSTLYCINGFSATGFSGLAHDSRIILRARVQVEWGYAISLQFIREALSKWPLNPEESDTLFYDEWLYKHVSGNRECLFPEVSRTLHFGMGANTNAFTTEAYFLSMPIVNASKVPLKGLDRLVLPKYSTDFKKRILNATLLTGSPCSKDFIPITTKPTDFVFYYNMTKDDKGKPVFLNHFYTAKCLNAWALSDQGLHDLVMTVRTSPTTTIFLVGAPSSPYGHFCPPSVKPWHFHSLTDQEYDELIEKIKYLELGNYEIPNTNMTTDSMMEIMTNNNNKDQKLPT